MAAKANPVPSVWARQQSTPDQPALSRASIVREAIAMLDADGIEALSMRKLGARLNAGATSLYRHVATKDELMELAVDEVAAEFTVPPPGGDWRAAATEAAVSFRSTALAHPWVSAVLGQAGLAYLGPNLMAYSERLASLFTAAGFPEPSRAIDTVLAYVIGMSTTEAAWLITVTRSGMSEAEFITGMMPAARQAAADHEHLAEAYADVAAQPAFDPVAIRDDKFFYGLDVVLDGLEMRLPR
ncbi:MULTISPECIES: TetR/AcrR family transcriptional regulator C-terminal domain-containing protein [Streptomyces]|uniref:Transcriptional regulator, TetR family n=1 Tax=Streptomyces venezuelae (strain ATCC 10712 / CBS 650.69 / DSM 40230 / JCM 4526 / NBRC 13096 / PD 04745) TaxID=953739 RepID=F2RC59_STRVP|nr:TetR/AcrR family transcriptional regulator C-terminal domain-containing protein [Streptomyces venezuelae]APE24806.1 TetR family transcriptional regulator [Streptomyces venezuelae]QES02152.1 TetR family transcriptional regulator [Streptomyces venezuelae ATCC 10712]QES09138.1 TetR family transcriptional regulator [Streptomyces venezuelae]CCA59310.1 Transcriptional regulator, TetR family [Streptomyces venezuelae ATCC 10712]